MQNEGVERVKRARHKGVRRWIYLRRDMRHRIDPVRERPGRDRIWAGAGFGWRGILTERDSGKRWPPLRRIP